MTYEFDLNKNFTVKLADAKDASAIHFLIKELADFYKKSNEPELSIEQLALDLDRKAVQSFLIYHFNENDKTKTEVAAMCFFYYAYSSFKGQCIFIEDLYVREQYRRHGLGRTLFKCIARLAIEKKMKRVVWNVFNWNKEADAFYKTFGAINLTNTEGSEVYLLGENYLKKLANE